MARHPKASPSSSKGRSTPESSPAAKNGIFRLFSLPKFSTLNWIILVLAAGALFFFKNKLLVGEVFLAIAVLLQVLPWVRREKVAGFLSWIGPAGPSLLFFLLIALWIGFSFELFQHFSHRWTVPKLSALPYYYSTSTLLIFWAGLFVVLRLSPAPASSGVDPSPRVTKFWLAVILGTAAWTVLYHVNSVITPSLEDNVLMPAVARYMFDIKDYRGFFSTHIGNDWPPLTTWGILFLYHVLPDITVALMGKIAGALGEAIFILLVYSAGKEAFNRRTGLFAAALVAVSQATVTKTLAVQYSDAPGIMMALVLWLFFRWARNPKILNFVFWGAAVALCLYCYLIYRPLVPFFIFSALGWILLHQKEERKMERPVLRVVLVSFLLFTTYVVYLNRFYAFDNPVSRILNFSGPWLPCAVLGLSLIYVASSVRPFLAALGRYPYLSGWVAGVWICIFVSFPKLADPYELWMMFIGGVSGGKPLTFKPLSFLTVMFDQNGLDWITLTFPGDPAYGWLEVACGGLGLALIFARPTLNRLYLLAIFAASFFIYFLTDSYHTLRLLPALVPFVLMGGMAINELWDWIKTLTRNRVVEVVVLVLLLGGWEWTARSSFERVAVQWGQRYFSVNRGVNLRAIEDQKLGYKVYVGPGFKWTVVNFVLYEKHPVELIKPSNLICLAPGEKPKDLSLFFMRTDPHAQDDILREAVAKNFPNAIWDEVRNPFTQDEWSVAARCVIPFADVADYSQKHMKEKERFLRAQKWHERFPLSPAPAPMAPLLFEVQQLSTPCWTRWYFSGYNSGLRPGIVDWADKTTQINDPVPSTVEMDHEVAQYSGTVQVGSEGVYEITCKTGNRTRILVDEKKMIDMAFPMTEHIRYSGPGETQTQSIHLKAGEHSVKVLTCFERAKTAPEISVRRKGSPGTGQSLWSSFNL